MSMAELTETEVQSSPAAPLRTATLPLALMSMRKQVTHAEKRRAPAADVPEGTTANSAKTPVRRQTTRFKTCYPLDLPTECEACELHEEFSEYYGEEIWLCA